MKSPNYRVVASYYDLLAKIIFGERMEKAKQAHLHLISNYQKVLVVGGGTGKLIDYIDELKNSVVVDFVDSTSKMISKARGRKPDNIDVNFYETPILEFDGEGYDVIFTNFFLDQFSEQGVIEIIEHLKSKLVPDGIILFSDLIQTNDIRDQIFDKIIYFFFRLFTGSTTRTYPPYHDIYSSFGFNRIGRLNFGRNIEASIYTISSQE